MPTPTVEFPHLLDALRADLNSADYRVDHLGELLGESGSAALHREQPTLARRILRGSDDSAAIMVRFFTLGECLAAAELDTAFPTLTADGLRRLRLAVAVANGHADEVRDSAAGLLRATCDLRPYGDETSSWWLASDLSELATGTVLGEDHVLGIGGASTTLAAWTIRDERASALDLGTGCGIQAVHLSKHTGHIVATDISERALDFARFNMALNEIDIDLRAGSMLEPVAGERFDLIVSNPPFVITPRAEGMPGYEYRDGQQVGDAIVRNLVRDVASHLKPGGVAQFLGNWELREGETFESVWTRWLADSPLDAFVVQREMQDPAQYAELWARDGGSGVGSELYERMYEAWLDDFDSRGVAHIGFGVVTLQRPETDRAPFRDLLDERGPVAPAVGSFIASGLKARTWLASVTDDEVLDTCWVAAADVTEERHTRPGASDPSLIMIRQGGGLGLSIQADTVLAALMSVCDGSMSARVALTAIASLVSVETDDAITKTLPLLKKLIANGFLERADA